MRRIDRTILIVLVIILCLVPAVSGCGEDSKTRVSSNGAGTVPEAVKDVEGGKARFKFIVCGDPQNNYEVFRKVLEAANNVDFLIIAGDLTERGSDAEVQTFLGEMQVCKVPYYTVPGNHDVYTAPVGVSYEPYFGNVPRSFDYMNTHFVLIDDSTPSLGFYPEEQEWVKADLAEASKRGYEHILAVCHVPPGYPYAARTTPEARVGVRANKELVPVLSAGGVEELFCGHYHTYRQFEEDGMIITISGGAGAHLHTSSSYHHYILVEINGKEMTQEVIKI
ncbi:MAG: metallophosphoesterase [Actinobacteria bacterium]|nr:metallophosphoesterase [Actinomycetota bacterium]